MDYGGGGAGSLFVSFNMVPILTFESPILDAGLGSVSIDVGRALPRRPGIINDSPTAIGDNLNLDGIGPDEVVSRLFSLVFSSYWVIAVPELRLAKSRLPRLAVPSLRKECDYMLNLTRAGIPARL